MSTPRLVSTPHGDARLTENVAQDAMATLLLNHGAGGGVEAPDLVALAQALPEQGISVLRLEMPWRVAGRRVAPRPAVLDECLTAVGSQLGVRTDLVVGGRSAGARAAARCAHRLGASGLLALAFPLHPPGRPDTSRLLELAAASVPTLVVQGERDVFGRPEEFPPSYDVAVVPTADHAFAVPARGDLTPEDSLGLVVEAALEWVVRSVGGNRTPH